MPQLKPKPLEPKSVTLYADQIVNILKFGDEETDYDVLLDELKEFDTTQGMQGARLLQSLQNVLCTHAISEEHKTIIENAINILLGNELETEGDEEEGDDEEPFGEDED